MALGSLSSNTILRESSGASAPLNTSKTSANGTATEPRAKLNKKSKKVKRERTTQAARMGSKLVQSKGQEKRMTRPETNGCVSIKISISFRKIIGKSSEPAEGKPAT
jgi:hypothetical protein